MRTGRLVALALIVIGLGAFVYFFERHQPTTSEAEERAKLVFPHLEPDEIRAVVVLNDSGSFRFVRDGETWQMTEPIAYPAEQSAVRNLVASLESLAVERRLAAGETDLAEYGLDETAPGVVLESTDGTERTLTVGHEAALGSNRAITLDGAEVLFVPKWFGSNVEKGLDEWRSHDVVDIAPSDVAGLEIGDAGSVVEIVRDNELWRLLEPRADLADRELVEGLISDLNALRIEKFVDTGPTASELGLEPPRLRVEIVRREGAEPVLLEFGTSKMGDSETAMVACRRNGTELLWVNDQAEERLASVPEAWRSHVVWPIETWDVESARFETGGRDVVVQRREGAWRCGEQPADGSAVMDRLSLVSGMRATAFDLIRPEGGRVDSVVLTLGKGDETREVRYSFLPPATNAGDALVAVSGRDTVMGVDADSVREVFEDLGALCEAPAAEEVTGSETAS